jgi:hypothetical protein
MSDPQHHGQRAKCNPTRSGEADGASGKAVKVTKGVQP